MVFVRDEGSVYDAPLEVVWDFFGSGQEHSDAHRHREVQRERLSAESGRYSWE
jgi:ligand-binding SRPBCC domain-containing protein